MTIERTVTEEELGISINRHAKPGINRFSDVFGGFDKVDAVRRIFGERTESIISELKVAVVSPRGYLRVDSETGNIMINPQYLREGPALYLYLDVIHELVHVRQFMEGKELYDRRYPYFERPTEIEAYLAAIGEAKRVGMVGEQLAEYLEVEWVTKEEFRTFLAKIGMSGV